LFYALPPYLQKKANQIVSCWQWLSYWTEVIVCFYCTKICLHVSTTIAHNINIPRWNLSNPWPKKPQKAVKICRVDLSWLTFIHISQHLSNVMHL
jgi:hypothetical protein